VTEESPYLKLVNQPRLNGGHQGIAFLKKNAMDVQNVEFARAYRLTDVVIEPLSFTVPRVKVLYYTAWIYVQN
jgi:coronin-7